MLNLWGKCPKWKVNTYYHAELRGAGDPQYSLIVKFIGMNKEI